MSGTRLGSDTAEFKGRLLPVFAALFCAFFFMAGRLWYLQVIRADHFEEASRSNHLPTRSDACADLAACAARCHPG